MKPRQYRRSFSAFFYLVLCCFSFTLLGQEYFILPLPGEGTATLCIDVPNGHAFITDGGKRGKGGIVGIKIDGKDILDYLDSRGVRRITFTCSHPDYDHLGGLLDLIKDPRLTKFTLDFVDSGFLKDTQLGSRSLYDHFEEAWKDKPQKPQAKYYSAANKDVLAELVAPNGPVRARNFKYVPEANKAHPHGNSVIDYYRLTDGKNSLNVVNGDDGIDDLIARFLDTEGRLLNPIDVILAPHHGSKYHDLAQMLRLAHKGTHVIFTVNPGNRFLHPGIRNLAAAIEVVGLDHVHFSGAGQLAFTATGIQSSGPQLSSEAKFHRFVLPQVEEIVREARELVTALHREPLRSAELLEGTKSLLEDLNAAAQVEAAMMNRPPAETLAAKVFLAIPPNTGDFVKAAQDVSRNIDFLHNSPLPPGQSSGFGGGPGGFSGGSGGSRGPATGGASAKPPRRPPSSPSSGGSIASAGGRGPRPGGGPRFRASLSMKPLFGGIVFGNTPVIAPTNPAAFTIAFTNGAPSIQVTLQQGEDKEVFDFRGITSEELWAAYLFVQPPDRMVQEFNLVDDECSLLGLLERAASFWCFNIHPALANTITARDAMRVDMLLANRDLPTLATNIFRDIQIAPNATYQWFDEETTIECRDGRVLVNSTNGSFSSVLSARFWVEKRPEWFNTNDLGNDSFVRERNRRLDMFVQTNDLGNTREYAYLKFERRVLDVLKKSSTVSTNILGVSVPQMSLADFNTNYSAALNICFATQRMRLNTATYESFSNLVQYLRLWNEVLDLAKQTPAPEWLKSAVTDDEKLDKIRIVVRRTMDNYEIVSPFPDPRRSAATRVVSEANDQVLAEARSEAIPSWLVTWLDGLSPTNKVVVTNILEVNRAPLLRRIEMMQTMTEEAFELQKQLSSLITQQATNRALPILRERGLEAAWRLNQLEDGLSVELQRDLRQNENSILPRSSVDTLVRRFDALSTLDRFARTVQLLRWIKEANGGHLPSLPPEVRPSGVFVQPVWDTKQILLN